MARRGIIRVATCQFATTGSVRRNAAQIRRQIAQAKRLRADVAHFPECALCGYPGADRESFDDLDWALLRSESESICKLAREKRIWVILGSAHPLTGTHLPHNSVYIIDPRGRIVDRYDKCFCTGGDLRLFSPGDHLPVFRINGVRCGTLICFDVRFPEIYRACKRLGVQCIFQSFHNAHRAEGGPNIWRTIMRRTAQAHAGMNYFWISANNSSARHQCWPSVFIRPNGEIARSLKFNTAGVMVNTVNTRVALYDPSAAQRPQAMSGILHSGRLVKDPRSRQRTCL